MTYDNLSENPYLLLTPGPLSTSRNVKLAMLKDWCTWDDDYNQLVQSIRKDVLDVAELSEQEYTTILMQGSGSFAVESVVGSVIPPAGKLLIISNGAYGERLIKIAKTLQIDTVILRYSELEIPKVDEIDTILKVDEEITHVAIIHCETTTGILNPIAEVGEVVKRHKKLFIVDAMSSFAGIAIDIQSIGIDFLISSANKCVQGIPGFGFIIAKRDEIDKTNGMARSHSLDLYDQWYHMEQFEGKWRFTSPTHVVHAFKEALNELKLETPQCRTIRYKTNQEILATGMKDLGFKVLIDEKVQSPIITSFLYPENDDFDFKSFYTLLKSKGYVIYPGKVSEHNCFRIGNIGEVYNTDINLLLGEIEDSMYWVE